MSPAALDLADRLLCYDPSRRITALQAMNAPYFTQEQPLETAPVGQVLCWLFYRTTNADNFEQVSNFGRRVARVGNETRASEEEEKNGDFRVMLLYYSWSIKLFVSLLQRYHTLHLYCR